jgi:hypothetical protein
MIKGVLGEVSLAFSIDRSVCMHGVLPLSIRRFLRSLGTKALYVPAGRLGKPT